MLGGSLVNQPGIILTQGDGQPLDTAGSALSAVQLNQASPGYTNLSDTGAGVEVLDRETLAKMRPSIRGSFVMGTQDSSGNVA